MGRLTRNEMLMSMASVVAQRGTCSRLQVGAVISRDGRIIATGYNGAPAGLPHCNHELDGAIIGRRISDRDGLLGEPIRLGSRSEVTTGGCTWAVHAEQNAIAFAARHGLALDRGELHVTHAPCASCARSIINAGIQRVTYTTPYRLTEGVDLLHQAGINVLAMPAKA